jgi:hypothetical protein
MTRFEIIQSFPDVPLTPRKGRLIEDAPMVDLFPETGNVYRIRDWISVNIMELEQLFNYDNPVTTWYLDLEGNVLDVHLKKIGHVEYLNID